MALLGWTAAGRSEPPATFHLHRWFPQLPAPREIWVVPFAGDVEEGTLLESAAGVASLAVQAGRAQALIYEEVGNEGYQRWFEQYVRAHSPKVSRMSLDAAIERLASAKVVEGYLLFRFEKSDRPLFDTGKIDESINVATSLAGAKRALVVSERLVPRVEKIGLKRLLDVRERTELWCLGQHEFSRELIGTAEPRMRNVRSLMIALNAFVCSGGGEAYKKGLARCEPDVPVLGWGCGPEDTQTMPSSEWGLFQTATNWCHNLTVFSTERVGGTLPAQQLRPPRSPHWSALDWGDGHHFVNFTLSDGDNVQWVMGNFAAGGEARSYYGNPSRGRFPLTWGLPVPSLCQLSPRTLAEILGRATPNDDFMDFSGAGYFYPDVYGKERGNTKALELHAERLQAYMDLTNIRILAFNFQDWDSATARRACEIFAAKLPGLLGIFAFQYYPYSGGEGAIYWVKGQGNDSVPVVSCRLTIWAQTGRPRDTTPAAVAAHLNRLPKAGGETAEAAFSWVLAHAWSRFRQVQDKNAPLDAEEKDVPQDKEAPGTARGYEPPGWAIDRLEPHVKAVGAHELLLRLRLRARPQSTLSRWFAEVEGATPPAARAEASDVNLKNARSCLARIANEPTAARECFEALKMEALRRGLQNPRGL